MTDLSIGERTTYYGYPIEREGEEEYRVEIYSDTFQEAKNVIKRCLEAGIIAWPTQSAGRRKKEVEL